MTTSQNILQIAKFGAHKTVDLYEAYLNLSLKVQRKIGVYRLSAKVLSSAPEYSTRHRALEALMYGHAQQITKIAVDALHQAIEAPEESTFETATKRLQYAQLEWLDKLAALAA